MTGDKLEKDKQSAKSWYWWGIPTFFRCDWNEDPAACDIALVGVPHSSGNGSTERDQHLGPRAVRNVSGFYRRPMPFTTLRRLRWRASMTLAMFPCPRP
jgi:guanidinopropionase